MNPLLAVLVGFNVAVLGAVWWFGALLGIAVVMGLCFAAALGLLLFSSPQREARVSKERYRALGLNTTLLASLGER